MCGQKGWQNKNVIRTTIALKVMVTLDLGPRVVVKVAEWIWKRLWNNDLVMLCGWEDARALHGKLYCVVCQKYEERIHGMKHLLCA